MRVGILALLHESNTFLSQPTTMDHFRENMLLVGDDVRQLLDTHHEVAGFLQVLDESPDLEAVGVFAARATPFGTITAATYRQLMEIMLKALDDAGPLDALLVAPHGANVSEDYPDMDGHWLGLVRERFGPGMPIMGTLDPHANLSPEMVEATDVLVAYRSNPHLDQLAVGREAADLLERRLAGSISPTMAASFPRMAMNIEKQQTDVAPCLPLYELADSQLQQERVLSNSILLGFPYSDVAEMGSAALAVTDDDPTLANQLAEQLGEYLWEHREEFLGTFLTIEEALQHASQLEGRVCLLDMGDNVGGGSPADSTFLLHALAGGNWGPSFVCLYDPESVQLAQQHGQGNRGRFRLGGKTDEFHGEPLEAECIVEGLYDGLFREPEPRHGGMTDANQGPTAVLSTDPGITVMLTSRRMAPFSLKQLTTFDVDPQQFKLLVAKGVNLPVAAYREVCPHMVRVNTAGVTTADMRQLEYQHRRRPLYPFES